MAGIKVEGLRACLKIAKAMNSSKTSQSMIQLAMIKFMLNRIKN